MLADTGIDVVADADAGATAVRLAGELAPDVVLLDMGLPDLDGVTVVRRITEARPECAVLVLTMHDDPALARAALAAGARGYLLKGVGRRELISAVRAIHDGEAVLDAGLLHSLTSETPAEQRPAPETAAAPALTAVEHDVLRLIAVGLTNREIASRMRWSIATAKKYVQRVLTRLEVPDRTRAAVVAVRRGLLTDDP